MKVSRKFLNDYIDISDLDIHDIAEKMTGVGNEYDSCEKLIPATNLVIGKVLECSDHPDSDHLHVCKVDIGTEVLDIVCGAPNCKKGIKVIGDVPFYVVYDSAEVYYNRDKFLLDENFNPTFVAGVAPDVFSDLGQRWGNPIYNFEAMKKDGYQLIIDRLMYAAELYDVVRIDHFRAFDTYYVIPAQYDDARIGEWKLGPAYDLFDKLFERAPDMKIIAEDLGDLRPEVLELRDHYNLPGMNILEFTIWDWMKDKEAYKKTLKPNCIAYIGTHDNETCNGWLGNRTKEEIARLNEFFGNPESIEDAMIKFGMDNFETFIVAAQDVLHLPADARINTPSTVNDINWTYRFTTLNDLGKALKKDIYR